MSRSRRLGIAGLALLAIATASMLLLHRARPDLDMIATPLSFYSHGRQAWLLTTSLIASGLAVMAIAGSLATGPGARLGIVALSLSGIGMVLAAIFVADPWFPWEKNLTPVGWAHAASVGTAVLAFPIGALFVSRESNPVGQRGSERRLLRLVGLGFAIVLGLFGTMTLVYLAADKSPGFLGLAERLLMTLAVAWLVIAAPLTKRVGR